VISQKASGLAIAIVGIPNLHGCLLNAASDTPTPDEIVEREEMWRLIGEALPSQHRAVVRLVFFDGRSRDEAADAIRLSRRRVGQILVESFNILRPHLESYRERRPRRERGHRCMTARDTAVLRHGTK
jgi:hypothetical protein